MSRVLLKVPELVSHEESVDPVEDAWKRDGLSPERGRIRVDGAEFGNEDLLLVEVLPLVPLRLFRGGGQRHTLSVDVPRSEEVETGRGVVHVQQGLLQCLHPDAVLGLVVFLESVELGVGEVGGRAQVPADLCHVEVLRLVLVPKKN